MGKLGYRPALDGVRALAIMPVVGLHAFGWPRQGALGVEIFFVLSGFLITTLLLEERVATGAARLVPGLVLMPPSTRSSPTGPTLGRLYLA